jgi:hypothetical protein
VLRTTSRPVTPFHLLFYRPCAGDPECGGILIQFLQVHVVQVCRVVRTENLPHNPKEPYPQLLSSAYFSGNHDSRSGSLNST